MAQSRTKKLILIIVSALVLLTVLLFTIRHKIYSEIEERVLSGISEALFTDAELQFDSFQLGLFPPSISIQGLELISHQDYENYRIEKAGDLLRAMRIEEVKIAKFDAWEILRNYDLKLGSVEIRSPKIDFVPPPGEIGDHAGDNDSATDAPSLKITDVRIADADIGLYSSFSPSVDAVASLNNVELVAEQFTYDGSQVQLGDIFSSLTLSAGSLEAQLNDYYKMELNNIGYSSREKSFSIQSSRFIPLYTTQIKSQMLGHQTDHFDGTSGTITLHDFDPDRWITDRMIEASHISVEGSRLIISRDKNFEDKPRTERPLPAVLFYQLPFGVTADSLTWSNGMLTYKEWRTGQVKAGEILFDEIDLKAYNFQNIDNTELIRIDAATKLMGESELNVQFRFSLQDDGRHDVEGRLSAMDLKKLNTALEPMAFARINSGSLSELTFNLVFDDQKAEGEMTILYDDLEMRLLDEETLEESRRLRVASFFANLVRIESSNSKDDPRVAVMELQRDPERSMFTFWWYTLRQGIEESVGM